MGLSIRAFAAHRGVSHTSVRKAIASGRLTRRIAPGYARAAAWIAGVDRWSEDRWEALETELKDGAGALRSGERVSSPKQSTRPVSGARDGIWINRRRGWIK
jgi:hypothetical protein